MNTLAPALHTLDLDVPHTFYKPAVRLSNLVLQPTTENLIADLEAVLTSSIDSLSISVEEACNILALTQYCCLVR